MRLLVAVLLSLAATVPVSSQTKPTVRVGYIPSDSFAALYIMADRHLPAAGIGAETVRLAGGTEILSQVATGQLQMGGTGMGAAGFNAVASSLPVEFVAPLHSGYVEDYFTVRKASWGKDIKRVADLKGKPVALNIRGAAVEWMLDQALRKDGLTLRDVEVKIMPFPDMVPALESGAVEAAILTEPFPTLAEERGIAVRPLPRPAGARATPITAIFWNKDWAAKDPELALQLLVSGSSDRRAREEVNARGGLNLELKRVESADQAIDRIDDAALVDEHVVDLHGAGSRSARRLRHVVGDLLGPERVRDVVGAHAAVEEGAEDDRLRLQVARHRAVLMQIVSAVSAASSLEFLHGRDREGRDRHGVGLVLDVDDPDELRPILAGHRGGFVGDDHELGIEERQQRVCEAGVRWVIVPPAQHARPGHVRDVQDDRSAVDIADPRAIGPARIDVRVVGAVAGVELRMTRRRRLRVAVTRAGEPPAPHLDGTRGLADIDDTVELIVLRIAGLEVRRTAGQMQVSAIDEPQVVHAARVRPGGVEERDRARLARIGHVEELDARRLHANPARLIRDDQQIAHEVQVVGAHVAVGQIGLDDDRGLPWIRHVHGGEVLRRRLVAEPQHPPPIAGQLDGHALPAIAEAAQIVVAQEPHVLRQGTVLCHGSSPGPRS